MGNKSKYFLQYGSIHLYLWLGMKLVIFYKTLKLKKSASLKKNIDFNTDKRKNAANSYEKYFFKQMNNRIFGKTMEKLRKTIKICKQTKVCFAEDI